MFEQLLHSHLRAFSEELAPYLAKWNNKLAIFNQEAPDDQSDGWGKGSQYGRIICSVNMQDNPERIVSGTLTVDVICQNGKQIPEELEAIVKPMIDGYFFTDSTKTVAAQWQSSSYFTDPERKEEGVTLVYALVAFPRQTTDDPDPIVLLNQYAKELLPDAVVIGLDTIDTVWKPQNSSPAVYWRIVSVAPCSWIPSTFSCSWQTAICQAHVIAPDKDTEAVISRCIDNGLSLKKCLIFPDKTVMRIDRNVRVNMGADPLQQGQVTVEATYGIVNKISASKIEKIYTRSVDAD